MDGRGKPVYLPSITSIGLPLTAPVYSYSEIPQGIEEKENINRSGAKPIAIATGIILFCLSAAAPFSVFAAEENFIISKKVDTKSSKNELKEDIGRQVRDALHECAELSGQIGKIQIELSAIQKNLFDKIEDLVDNKPPFKKAKRADLLDSLQIMQMVKNEFVAQVQVVKKLSAKLQNNKCFKKA